MTIVDQHTQDEKGRRSIIMDLDLDTVTRAAHE